MSRLVYRIIWHCCRSRAGNQADMKGSGSLMDVNFNHLLILSQQSEQLTIGYTTHYVQFRRHVRIASHLQRIFLQSMKWVRLVFFCRILIVTRGGDRLAPEPTR